MTDTAAQIEQERIKGKARRRDDEDLLLLALLSLGDVEEAVGYWRRLAPDRFKGVINARLARVGFPAEAVASSSYPAYDPAQFAYVDRMGDVIDPLDVRLAVLSVIDAARLEYEATTALMLAGSIALDEWQETQSHAVKLLHLGVGAVGAGGSKQLTADQLARSAESVPETMESVDTLGDLILFQIARLQQFALQIEQNHSSADTAPRITNRVGLYATSAYPTFTRSRAFAAIVAGMTQERNVLRPAEHCRAGDGDLLEDCPSQSDKGWVTVGELVPIGQRLCGFGCKCVMEYRRGTHDQN